eukprot:CAMPEP_0175902074 /NCGR_PEP_ID=MMETSP0108-20121206/3197_1 /TAXON_ID=195067 ORGANISM="Goniomonas pacifica, Strain CCMP1869" /NCGR_SAMPLE_ID=MMETSP0108 /ASSEMBLY_ACC=CAM_ASM_000204 /LENGTH=294 /DNA_ID=CAMNT_0017223691 /DNA_START=1 /DNA_END=885 /DNA_ORIENTATION=-
MPPKHAYAVVRGRIPGIYKSWEECKAQVEKFPNALYKGFWKTKEAEAFLTEHGAPEAPKEAGVKRQISPATVASQRRKPKQTFNRVKWTVPLPTTNAEPHPYEALCLLESGVRICAECQLLFTNGCIKCPVCSMDATIPDKNFPTCFDNKMFVYTDGASSNNGKATACAGVGVWFGSDQDPRNVSERLVGRQTNQRAELTAALRALQICPDDALVYLVTDSKYTVDAMTDWIKSWLEKDRFEDGTLANGDLLEELWRSVCMRHVAWIHVPGHGNVIGNIAADRLAVVRREERKS